VLPSRLSPWELDWLGVELASDITAANADALLKGVRNLALPFVSAPAVHGRVAREVVR
jgi:hypothetical protein